MLKKYSLPGMERVWSEENKYKKWLAIEIAVCRARSRLGEIPPEAVAKIEKEVRLNLPRIKEIEKENRHDLLAFVEGINETLGGESRFIHKGLTSSDIKDTALALQMKEAVEIIVDDLQKLLEILAAQASRHKKTVMIGRTHGVHAEPVTWGLKLATWYQEINRHLTRMEQVREIVAVGKLSGAVGTFSSIDPRVEEMVCAELGITPALVSSQILQRDRHADLVTRLALIASSLEKFTTEIRNLHRTDILEVEEGFHSGQKGSSAMPHKKNPIISERISGLARVIRGNVVPALEDVNLWHERDLTHSSVERIILPDSTILLDYMINKFITVLKELKINKDRMTENLDRTRGLVFSQRVMLALIDKDLTREKAYELAQRNALTAWNNGTDYLELIKEDPEISKLLTDEEMENVFNYFNFLENIDLIFARMGL